MSATEDIVRAGTPAEEADDTHISRALLMVATAVILGAIMAFAHTFVWACVLLVIALIGSLTLPKSRPEFGDAAAAVPI
jgi:hypothetical protein